MMRIGRLAPQAGMPHNSVLKDCSHAKIFFIDHCLCGGCVSGGGNL